MKPTFTIGIEEEYQTVDPVTRDLRSHIHAEIIEKGKSGTIKVKGVVDSQVSTSNGNEPHLSTGCVNIAADGFTPSSDPVFTPVAPTADATITATKSGDWWSVGPAASNTGLPGPSGFHIRVSVDGKTKVFWVKAGAPLCTVTTTGTGGVTVDPGSGPAVF